MGLAAACGGGGAGLRENSAVELRYQIMAAQAMMSRETMSEINKPVPCFTGAVVIVSGGYGQRQIHRNKACKGRVDGLSGWA